MDIKDIESAIEGILFAAGEPVRKDRICQVLELDLETVDAVARRIADHYQYERRGIRMLRLEDAYQLCSAPEHAETIRKVFEARKPQQLSAPALEALALIAYFQPTTRAYVEQIRGVDSTHTVALLQERDLIEGCGRLNVPGRPILYQTTKTFLRSFGLSSLEELPPLPGVGEEAEQITLDIQVAMAQLAGKGRLEQEEG